MNSSEKLEKIMNIYKDDMKKLNETAKKLHEERHGEEFLKNMVKEEVNLLFKMQEELTKNNFPKLTEEHELAACCLSYVTLHRVICKIINQLNDDRIHGVVHELVNKLTDVFMMLEQEIENDPLSLNPKNQKENPLK